MMKNAGRLLLVVIHCLLLPLGFKAHAQSGVLGKMMRNAQGGSLHTLLENGAGLNGRYSVVFPAASGSVLLNTDGQVNLRPAGSATELRFFNPSGTFFTGLRAGAAGANTTFTLPVADGAAGQLLSTNGSGQLQWVNSASGTTGGWSLSGNSATNATTNFLGTTDNAGLALRTNNIQRMFIDPTGNVGIGLSNPGATLSVQNSIEISRQASAAASLLFTNTASSGDFRIGADGGDFFWQGGGGRNLQMGSFWTTILAGDRQQTGFPAFSANGSTGTFNTGVLIPAQRAASVPLAVQGFASGTANLQEWRNASGTALSVVSSSGMLGLGTAAPSAALHVVGDGLVPSFIARASGSQDILQLQNTAGTAILRAAPGALTIEPHSGVAQELRFRQGNGGTSYVGFRAPAAVSTALVWTLPGTDGTAGQVLTTNGASQLQWAAVSNTANSWSTSGNSNTSSAVLGTLDNNPLRFVAGSNTSAERMRITSSGNVGINTTNPAIQASLHIGANPSVSNPRLLIDRNGTLGGFTTTASDFVVGSNTGAVRFRSGITTGGDWSSEGTERMVIHNTGQVAIPGSVAIGAAATTATLLVNGDGSAASNSGVVRMVSTGSNKFVTLSFPDGAAAGDPSNLYAIGRGNLFSDREFSFIIPDASRYNGGTQPRFTWYSITNTGFPTELLTLDAVNGDLRIKGRSISSSDRRLKQHIRSLQPEALDIIRNINGVSYQWNETASKVYQHDTLQKQYGVLAQEVEQVLPELVQTDEKGFKTVHYDGLIPVMLAAIKAQQAQIEELKKEISNLKKNQ